MKHRTKQRLVGAAVFAAILAIFVPLLFHSSNIPNQTRLASKIPPPPQIKPQAEPHVSAVRAQLWGPAPQAWVLQLGAFTSKANAEQLVKRLRQAKIDVYTRQSTDKHGKLMIRIYVGPEIRRDSLVAIQTELKEKYNLTGVIKRYQL